MILVDTNYFLRYLTQPVTPNDRVMRETARTLFETVQRGEEECTTTEVVLHEVIYILASRRHYNASADDIAAALKLVLQLPGFRLPRGDKRRYLRALDLYETHPTLGFADAVVAATVEQQDIPLATFDSHFDRLPGIARWQPPPTDTSM